MFGLTGLIIAT